MHTWCARRGQSSAVAEVNYRGREKKSRASRFGNALLLIGGLGTMMSAEPVD
jgi:hypothetical protein